MLMCTKLLQTEIRQRWLLSWCPVSDACQPSPLESPRELDVFRFGLTMGFASLKLELTQHDQNFVVAHVGIFKKPLAPLPSLGVTHKLILQNTCFRDVIGDVSFHNCRFPSFLSIWCCFDLICSPSLRLGTLKRERRRRGCNSAQKRSGQAPATCQIIRWTYRIQEPYRWRATVDSRSFSMKTPFR